MLVYYQGIFCFNNNKKSCFIKNKGIKIKKMAKTCNSLSNDGSLVKYIIMFNDELFRFEINKRNANF